MANQHCQLPFDLANAKVLIQIDGKTVDINRYLDVTDEVRERIWQGAEQVWLAKVREVRHPARYSSCRCKPDKSPCFTL